MKDAEPLRTNNQSCASSILKNLPDGEKPRFLGLGRLETN